MKKILMTLALALTTMCANAKGAKTPVFAWSGWGENTTEKSLTADFKAWKKHGVTGVCVNAGMDVEKIAVAAKVAKKVGLEYHAWVPTMVQGGKPKSWYTVNRLGESASDKPAYVPYYTTLDPRNKEVRKFLVEKFEEIASIPEVDYVQLDYIRYADVILARGLWDKYGLTMNGEYAKADYCYCDDCVAAFKQQSGIDITKVTDPSKIKEWAQFRCDAVTDLVNAISDAVHAKQKKLSADVFPGPKSYAEWMVRQQWNNWKLDAVFPMNYNDFYMEPAAWVGKVTKEEVEAKIKQVKSVLFNFTTDNMEEFRKQIDEVDNKDSLYELRNTLSEAKAIVNQVRSFGDEETKQKLASLPIGTIPTLITEVTHRIERINLLENTEHKADVSGIINVALSELEFEFKKGMPEEMRIIVNDIRERCERVQAEFEANFDTKEDKYVILADEFREYFRKKGFIPKDTADAKESIQYMDEVMKKIREINRRNRLLKSKYKGDERFVRIHKRIEEQNEKREKPIISKHEYEIAENLANMKQDIDRMIFLDINKLDNEPAFQQDVLAIIGKELLKMHIRADIKDRKFINNLITTEYLQQRNYAY